MNAQANPVLWSLVAAFVVGLAAFAWLVGQGRQKDDAEDERPADGLAKRSGSRLPAITGLVFLGLLIVLGYGALNSAADNSDNFEVLIDEPRMINQEMRIDRAYIQGDVLTMEGTMVQLDDTQHDLAGIGSIMKNFYLKLSCSDPQGRSSLESGSIAKFHVSDRNGVRIADVEVSENDCLSYESGQEQAISEWPGVRGSPMLAMPEMIEPNMRLEQIFSDEKAMYYVYTRLDVLRHEMDLHAYDREVRSGIRSDACSNPANRAPLDAGKSMVFIYNDKAGDLMIKVTVTSDTCGG